MLSRIYTWLCIHIREHLNPYLGPIRRKKLNCEEFTIIANNCWGGHVYRYFNKEYLSPTVGLYFFAEDYVKFIGSLKQYLDKELKFIPYTESRYRQVLERRGETHVPIGKLDDVEIVFLHYKSEEEAKKKWNRRKERIVWDNLIFKMSEQNLCTEKDILDYDSLPYNRKFIFVTKDYGIKSQVLFKEYEGTGDVKLDTPKFRKYINLTKLINGEYFKKRQPDAFK